MPNIIHLEDFITDYKPLDAKGKHISNIEAFSEAIQGIEYFNKNPEILSSTALENRLWTVTTDTSPATCIYPGFVPDDEEDEKNRVLGYVITEKSTTVTQVLVSTTQVTAYLTNEERDIFFKETKLTNNQKQSTVYFCGYSEIKDTEVGKRFANILHDLDILILGWSEPRES